MKKSEHSLSRASKKVRHDSLNKDTGRRCQQEHARPSRRFPDAESLHDACNENDRRIQELENIVDQLKIELQSSSFKKKR